MMFLILLVAAHALGVASPSSDSAVELRAVVRPNGTHGKNGQELLLTLCNHSATVATIVKPMFPTAWSVARTYQDSGQVKRDLQHGGLGRGHPSTGYPNRYTSDEYVALVPTQCHEKTSNLEWYLGFPGNEVKPGKYELSFVYSYEPSVDELHIPLVTGPVRSNVVEVVVDAPSSPKSLERD